MKVLVTGGSGFIGTNMVEYLLKLGHAVFNIDIQPPSDSTHDEHWVAVDINDGAALTEVFQRISPEWVIHLAARADCDETVTVEEGYQSNTVGHQNVLDAIKATPSIRRAVITSSQYVCGPGHVPVDEFDFAPATVYGQSKVISEKLVYQAGLECEWTLVRPTNVWGPWHMRYQREFWKIAQKGLYIHPGGKPVVRCYGYVGNVVDYIYRILNLEAASVNRRVFYLSDPPDDIYQWANAFCLALGGAPARRVPRWILRCLGSAGDLITKLSGKRFYITSSRVTSMTSDYDVPNWIDDAIRVLGEPRYSLGEGVAVSAAWYRRYTFRKKVRIVVAGQLPPPVGGQNIMIERTLEGLRRKGDWEVEHLAMNFNQSFTEIRRFSVGKMLELLRVVGRLLRLRWHGPVDLMLFPFGGKHPVPMVRDMLLMPLCLLLSKRLVVWFHTGGIADVVGSYAAVLRSPYRAIFGKARAAVVMTDFNKCDPLSLGIEEVHVLPHRMPDTAHLDAEMVRSEPPKVLYLGHLYPDKGIVQLLEAFDLVADGNPRVELDLVGEVVAPWTNKIVREMIDGMRNGGRVKWHGLALGKEKDEFFRRASLFVFPSIAPGESFGLVMVEALMWGLPVVAADWRGAADVLTKDFYGRMVACNPLSGTNLAAAINEVLSEPGRWAEGRTRNREIYLKYYAEGSQPTALWNLIETLLSKPGVAGV